MSQNRRRGRRTAFIIVAAVLLLAAAMGGGLYSYEWWLDQPVNPVTADGSPEIMVMDLSVARKSYQGRLVKPGWRHRTFWTRPPMEISYAFGGKDGVPATRFETKASGSIYGRFTDIDLGDYPSLAWSWFIEKPIESNVDERTREGDDHPARLFIIFGDSTGESHYVEIIWSNKLFKAGEYKYVGDFPHYVANGGNENIGRWIEEKVDLLDIYRTTTKRTDTPRVKFIAIFCDSDDTGTSSVAYFSKVWLAKAGE